MCRRRYGSEEFKSSLAEGSSGGRTRLAVDLPKGDLLAAVLGPDAGVRVAFRRRHPGQTLEVLKCRERLAAAVALDVALEPSRTCGDALIGQGRWLGVPVYRARGWIKGSEIVPHGRLAWGDAIVAEQRVPTPASRDRDPAQAGCVPSPPPLTLPGGDPTDEVIATQPRNRTTHADCGDDVSPRMLSYG